MRSIIRDTMFEIKAYMNILHQHFFLFLFCILLSIVSQLLSLSLPLLTGTLIHELEQSQSHLNTIIIALLVLIGSSICAVILSRLIGKIGVESVSRLRASKIDRLSKTDLLSIDALSPNWIEQRVFNDSEMLLQMPEYILSLIQGMLILLISIYFLINLSLKILLIGLILGGFSLAYSTRSSMKLNSQLLRLRNLTNQSLSELSNIIYTQRLQKAYSIWEKSLNEIKKQVEFLQGLSTRYIRLASILQPASQAFMQIADLGIIIFGAFEVATGDMSFPNLIIFMMYFSYFSRSINLLTSNIKNIATLKVYLKRLNELDLLPLSTTVQTNYSRPINTKIEDIKFSNVIFKYPGDRSTVGPISLTIPKGCITAIIGLSGSGKSTLIGLLEKFYTPDSGTIKYGNINIANINTDTWREGISYIDQNALCIAGTIRYNITMQNSKQFDAELFRILNHLNWDFSIGLDTVIHPHNTELSGGQRQILSLARAIFKNASLLLLDEPTANLDGVSEKDFFDQVRDSFNGRTVVYTAHRSSMIRRADWVIVMHDGRIAAIGTPLQLANSCKLYQLLINSQDK